MPIYEYQCPVCKKKQEMLQRMNKAEAPTCKPCKVKTQRVVSSTTFSLKGDGWYRDGYGLRSE
jgi:putative FmdB family regulatory protein|tara:strand:- start:2109 stop:2297 length:189 start_codon:yes stop_codon:yes gene_type:complete